jgi:hypothetical protein
MENGDLKTAELRNRFPITAACSWIPLTGSPENYLKTQKDMKYTTVVTRNDLWHLEACSACKHAYHLPPHLLQAAGRFADLKH